MMFYRIKTWDLSPHCTHSFHSALTPLTLQLLSTVESGETASQRYPCIMEL